MVTYFVLLVLFFSSTGKEPISVAVRAPSAEACETARQRNIQTASRDPEVEGYSFTCITVPSKT